MKTLQTIQTKRLTLEPMNLSDTAAIFAIASDKRSIEDYQHTAHDIEDVRHWLEPGFYDPDEYFWTVRIAEKIVGGFEVTLKPEYSDLTRGVCRIGYFLDHSEQNRGYMTEALLAVVEWLFVDPEIERIEAGVTLSNVPSHRVLEKAGFIRERVVSDSWEWNGKLYDSAYYYLPRAAHRTE